MLLRRLFPRSKYVTRFPKKVLLRNYCNPKDLFQIMKPFYDANLPILNVEKEKFTITVVPHQSYVTIRKNGNVLAIEKPKQMDGTGITHFVEISDFEITALIDEIVNARTFTEQNKNNVTANARTLTEQNKNNVTKETKENNYLSSVALKIIEFIASFFLAVVIFIVVMSILIFVLPRELSAPIFWILFIIMIVPEPFQPLACCIILFLLIAQN